MSTISSNARSKLNTHQMTLVGLMTAVTCILAPFSLVLPFSPVPVSLGTLAIYFSLIVLGRRLGTLSVILYLLLGLAGLPVFTGFTGGAGRLFGPTGGYLIGYIFMALVCGYFIDKSVQRISIAICGLLLGTLVCYLLGTLWLSYQSGMNFAAALAAAVLPFIPGDLVKITLAILLGGQVRKRLLKSGSL